MKYFVAETKRFKEESRNGVKLSLASDFEAIERAAPNRKDDKYRIKPYYHAIRGHLVPVYRYEQRTINGLDVCCYFALCVLAHDEAYDDFVDSRTDDKRREQVAGWKDLHVIQIEGNSGCETGVWNSVEEVWTEIAKRLSEGKDDSLRSLSDKEYTFLYDDTRIVEDLFQTPIFETKEWVDILAKDERTSGYEHIIELANGISRKYEEWATDPGQEKFIVYKEPFYNDINKQQDQYFLCWGVRGDEKEKGGDNIDRWFNISVGTLAEIEAVEEKYRDYFNKGDYKRLARHCRRGYPYKILEQNKDVWKKMEEDKNSSLVLSDEELDVLSSHLTYPLFLTGRAGSGKSTMLQYLFSEYVIRYVASKIETPPLYLSWSEFLVAKAKDVATTLLEKNPAYTKVLDNYGIVYGRDVKPILPSLFKSFAELVKDCIRKRNPGVLSKRFAAGKYISFPLFKVMWNERFGQDHEAATKYGPELSWHIIRSYIKGWDCAKLLQPTDFNKIGKSYQDVSEEEYKLVYNKVWKDWYSKIGNDRRWDDLDLVRYCLQPDDGSDSCITEGTYSAIFCDESQDFTRVETELILKLSIFTQRKLNVDDVSRLPIVFAGDEAQTLNPTGFSWDSLRSYFTDRLNTMLQLKDRGASLSAPPTWTLKQNYRSLPPIVRLGNRIQLLRHIMGLGSDEKFERQLSYDEGCEGKPVYCLNPNDPDVWAKLQELNAVVIIPSNDGQTDEEFFRSTPVGRERMIEFYDSGENKGDAIGLTIFNPMQAKGQEFPCVAVYGFDLPEILSKRLSGVTLLDELTGEKRDLNGVKSQEIALKYFLSNAYVAVTRAETQLFILSNCRDPHTFWSFAYQSANVDENVSGRIEDTMLKRLQEENKDRDACKSKDIRGLIIAGGVDTLESGEVADAHVVAQRAYNLGKSRADARAMRKAASKYSDIGDGKQATICKGFAFGYEGRYEEAAECFSSAGWRNKAIESYWLALNEESVERIIPSLAGIGGTRIEVRIATQLKNADITYASLKQDLEEITSSIRQNDQHISGSLNENNDVANGEDVIGTSFYEQQETWQFVLGRLLDKLPPFRAIDTQHVKVILNQFDKLSSYEVEVPVDKVSRLAIAAKCYTWVIAAWERKYTDDGLKREGVGAQSYWESRAALTEDYSEKVIYLKQSGIADWKQKVMREFRRNEEQFPQGGDARTIMAEVGIESDSLSLVRKSTACLLSTATTIDKGETWVARAFKEGMSPFSRVCAYAMLRTRLHEKFDRKSYLKHNSELKTQQLFDVLEEIFRVSGDAFRSKLAAAKEGAVNVATKVLTTRMQNPWMQYFAVAVGAILEERRYYIDCVKYYEWVKKNPSTNPELKRLVDLRLIKNMDRYLDRREQQEMLNDTGNAAQKRRAANEIAFERAKLKRLMSDAGIADIEDIPEAFDIDWEKFLEEIFREIPADIEEPVVANDQVETQGADRAKEEDGEPTDNVAEGGSGGGGEASGDGRDKDAECEGGYEDTIMPENTTVNDQEVEQRDDGRSSSDSDGDASGDGDLDLIQVESLDEGSAVWGQSPDNAGMVRIRDFCESEFGRKCSEWLREDLKENGPINWSVFGTAGFLPEGISVGRWLAFLESDFIKRHAKGNGQDYCELKELSPDSRSVRTNPDILPEWMHRNYRPVVRPSKIGGKKQAGFFVGIVRRKKKSAIGIEWEYFASDIVLKDSDESPDSIPLPTFSGEVGEFVIGLNKYKKSFAFYNAVQIVPWNSFDESADTRSAVEYFSRNQHGALTAKFPYLIGNERIPRDVVIVDNDVYLKGFSSSGQGKLTYCDVKRYDGVFPDDVIMSNQGVEIKYRGYDLGFLIPPEKSQAPILDGTGWVALFEKSDEMITIGEILPTVEDATVVENPPISGGVSDVSSAVSSPIPVDGETAEAPDDGIPKPHSGKSDETFVLEDEGLQTEAKPVAFELIHVESQASSSSVPEPETTSVEDEITFLNNFAQYVEACGFVYSPRDLIRFHTSVKCGMCTLIGGEPGAGKSSLVELYFRALGGMRNGQEDEKTFLRIDVNPTWMEPSDLIGFKGKDGKFNEVSGIYGFLKGARHDALLPICLEEINLACVEHYFSDFIQIISRNGGDVHCDEGNITVSDSVRFVGTCNFDESTRPISSRFLNRCNMIELDMGEDDREKLIAAAVAGQCAKPKKYEFGAEITAGTFANWRKGGIPIAEMEAVRDMLKLAKDEIPVEAMSLAQKFKDVGVLPSPRVISEMAQYIRNRPPVGEKWERLDSGSIVNLALDECIAQRILSCYRTSPGTMSAFGSIQRSLDEKGFKLSAALAQRRIDAYKNMLNDGMIE